MEEVTILIISIVAGMATYIVSHILNRGAVIASAIITLVSGLMLPYFFPTIGNVLATAAACSSYAGMISLENALNLLEMAIISLMTGILFIAAGVSVYTGMVVGSNAKGVDLEVNICRKKQQSNVRSSGADDSLKLSPARNMSLEEALEFIDDDELVEITPDSIRLRKRFLNENERLKYNKSRQSK